MNGSQTMPNGQSRDDRFQTSLDVTNNRVSTLETSVRDLASSQAQLGIRLSAEISAVANGLSAKLEGLAGQFADRSKIPWPALGVMLTFITIVGGLVWYPVKDQQDTLRTAVLRIAENAVTKADLDYRLSVTGQRRDELQRVTEERFKRLDSDVRDIENGLVTRGEHQKWWSSQDQAVANVQRQIDDLKKAFGDTYSLRDGFMQVQRRLDMIESQWFRAGASPSG
jgi:hypothetical protein